MPPQRYLIPTDPATPSCGENITNSPSPAVFSAIPPVAELLRGQIHRSGPLRFPDFMATALYHPTHGYYARGTRQIGRGGDFFTSVSVGPLFGELLARRFLAEWRLTGCPAPWRIIEAGAHDGTLAADVLTALRSLDTRAFDALDYVIAEPLPALQAAQRATLEPFRQRVRIIADLTALAADPLPGIAFGNEVLDALPCHLVQRSENRWLERLVAVNADGHFVWETGEIGDPVLLDMLSLLGDDFPTGYRSEARTCYAGLLEPLARALHHGLMVWIDYGFARPDYYHPDRTTGTLRTFANHQAGDDPLLSPGLTDITAHVDFTAVAEAAQTLGGHSVGFRSQGSWLIDTARAMLLERDGHPDPAFARQFQTLTHPAHLGGRFHVLELSWEPDLLGLR